MKKKFNEAAMTRFGSGWAWLGVKADGSLAITSTANQGKKYTNIYLNNSHYNKYLQVCFIFDR